MAKKSKSAEDIIYQIKDLLEDLELKINPEDNWSDDDDEDLDIENEDDEE